MTVAAELLVGMPVCGVPGHDDRERGGSGSAESAPAGDDDPAVRLDGQALAVPVDWCRVQRLVEIVDRDAACPNAASLRSVCGSYPTSSSR